MGECQWFRDGQERDWRENGTGMGGWMGLVRKWPCGETPPSWTLFPNKTLSLARARARARVRLRTCGRAAAPQQSKDSDLGVVSSPRISGSIAGPINLKDPAVLLGLRPGTCA